MNFRVFLLFLLFKLMIFSIITAVDQDCSEYVDDKDCKLCEEECEIWGPDREATHTKNTKETCLLMNLNFGKDDKGCFQCDKECPVCSRSDCLSPRTSFNRSDGDCPRGFKIGHAEKDGQFTCVLEKNIDLSRCASSCLLCMPNYELELECLACRVGYYMNDTTKQCQSNCSAGFGPQSIRDNRCVSCFAEHCESCPRLASECIKCEKGYIFKANQIDECVEDTNVAPPGWYIAEIDKTKWLLNCPFNCKICANVAMCKNCSGDDILDEKRGVCRPKKLNEIQTHSCDPACQDKCVEGKPTVCRKCRHFTIMTGNQMLCVPVCPRQMIANSERYCVPRIPKWVNYDGVPDLNLPPLSEKKSLAAVILAAVVYTLLHLLAVVAAVLLNRRWQFLRGPKRGNEKELVASPVDVMP